MQNRETLQALFADRVVEAMDMGELVSYATDRLMDSYASMTDAQLQEEIEDFAPDLLDLNLDT